MDPENPSDCSHPHPFLIELKSLLLEDWIFASSWRLKDPPASLATIKLDNTIGAIENRDQNERSEDIALFVLQLTEITSFV